MKTSSEHNQFHENWQTLTLLPSEGELSRSTSSLFRVSWTVLISSKLKSCFYILLPGSLSKLKLDSISQLHNNKPTLGNISISARNEQIHLVPHRIFLACSFDQHTIIYKTSGEPWHRFESGLWTEVHHKVNREWHREPLTRLAYRCLVSSSSLFSISTSTALWTNSISCDLPHASENYQKAF